MQALPKVKCQPVPDIVKVKKRIRHVKKKKSGLIIIDLNVSY